jgi:hypothetical protein
MIPALIGTLTFLQRFADHDLRRPEGRDKKLIECALFAICRSPAVPRRARMRHSRDRRLAENAGALGFECSKTTAALDLGQCRFRREFI